MVESKQLTNEYNKRNRLKNMENKLVVPGDREGIWERWQ